MYKFPTTESLDRISTELVFTHNTENKLYVLNECALNDINTKYNESAKQISADILQDILNELQKTNIQCGQVKLQQNNSVNIYTDNLDILKNECIKNIQHFPESLQEAEIEYYQRLAKNYEYDNIIQNNLNCDLDQDHIDINSIDEKINSYKLQIKKNIEQSYYIRGQYFF